MKYIVFVYGTLREHEANAHYMKTAKLLSKQAFIYGRLWDTGRGYPAVTLDREKKVYGELYQVDDDTMKRLDELEDYNGEEGPNEYDRLEQTVYTDAGTFTAYVYVYPGVPEYGKLIECGDWKHRVD